MTQRYRITRTARADLREIADSWSQEASAEIAEKVLRTILETVIVLAHHPAAGIQSDFAVNVRRFPAGQYVLYYRPGRNRIDLLHVFHGKRDQRSAWR